MELKTYCGDSRTLQIPLSWQGVPFTPDAADSLIFTVKSALTDPDANALIQKASGAGLTVSGSTAAAALVYEDTADLNPATAYFDVQWQSDTTGEVRTVAYGRLHLKRDVTREISTSVPIFTTDPPIPGGASDVSDLTTTGLTAGNLLRVADGGGLEEITPVLTRTAAEGDPVGSQQTEKVECLGTVTSSINVTVTVTGGPFLVTYNVGVTAGDTPSVWLGKIIAQINGSGLYEAGSDGNFLLLTTPSSGSWPTMNVAIGDPNGSGITPSPTSETLVEGASPLAASFLGQKCIVGDGGTGNGKRLEYTSLDGETWTLTGPAGVQEDASTPGNLIVTTFGAGATPTYESQTISNYLTA